MQLKLLSVLIATLLLVAPGRPDDATAEVHTAIDALNRAFAKGDAKVVAALMTEDHRAVTPYYAKPLSREEQVRTLADHKLSEYTPGKLTVRLLGHDAALVTYAVVMKGTYQGKAVPARSFASAVWVRKGGRWLESFYQETALPGE